MNKLPEVCKECAEYGSDFCDDCVEELTKNLPEQDKVRFNKIIRNIANHTEKKN
jgi:hypothetical protein